MKKTFLILICLIANFSYAQDREYIQFYTTDLSQDLDMIDLNCHSADKFNGFFCPTLDSRNYIEDANRALIIKSLLSKFGENAKLSSPEKVVSRIFDTIAIQLDYVVKYELRGNPQRVQDLSKTMDDYLDYLRKLAAESDFVLLDYYGSWGTRLNATTLYFINMKNKTVLKIDHGL